MPDDRTQEALEHFQVAALELIAAFRAILDVAEEAVREPQGLLEVVTATARAAARSTGGGRAGAPPRTDEFLHDAGDRAADPGVEHIRIT